MTFNSTKNYEKIDAYLSISERSRFFPKILKSRGGRAGVNITTLNLNKIEFDIDYTSEYKNYDEPRSTDIFILDPAELELNFEYSSDIRKKIQYGFGLSHSFGLNEDFNEDKKDFDVKTSLGIRASNKLNFNYDLKIFVKL